MGKMRGFTWQLPPSLEAKLTVFSKNSTSPASESASGPKTRKEPIL